MKRNVLHIRKIDLGPVLSTIAFLAMVERYLRKNKRKKRKKKKKEGKKEKIPVKIKRKRAIRMEQDMI